ncbi:HAD family hydrolase [Candidatus Tisiphia endosymbiont of Nedyus quadrimaculatus]|uniref:HAD family hydrolase n=1 Tax=Candidatus Tisiphia endosymbiont of Nedyus quadrimaculatus TaxID=3139332 RepID=UPI00345E0F4A
MSKVKKARLELPPFDFSIVKDKWVMNTLNADQLEIKQQKDSLEKETQSDKTLLCIDWDGTIVKDSLHNALYSTFLDHEDCVNRFLADETTNWKNKDILVELLKKALTIGCHIAIVSFGSYPDWIKYALKQLALESTLLEKIYVVSHPHGNNYEGKQEHIEEAKKHFGVSDNKKVVLIDDDSDNVDIARKNGMQGIDVTEDIGYLTEASKIVTAQEQKENQIQTDFDQPTESKLELLGEYLPSLGDFSLVDSYDTL